MHDAVIIGSGAGGGAVAWRLASAGWRVLVLERGPRYSRDDLRHDRLKPGDFVPRIEDDPHTVVTARTTTPQRTTLGWIATCVGGGTVHMGGYFYRFHPDDFRMRSRFGEYLALADWPYGYDELAPYYAEAERMMGVSTLKAHPFARRIDEACRARGWHPFATPRAINAEPYDGRPACDYCAVCASYGCPVGARGSAQETFLAHAERTGRCEVRPLSFVHRIDANGDRVTGCTYLDERGEEHHAAARVVILSASSIESARLLLLSNLANEEGQVGKHLQFHAVTMGQALFEGDELRDPHPFLGRSIDDFYFLPDGVSDIAKGGMIRFGLAPQVSGARHFEPTDAQRILYFEAFHDFLPNADTFVTLDDAITDRHGFAVARIHLAVPQHHRRAGRFLADRAFDIYEDLGALEGVTTDVGSTSSYLVHGTCRMGNDPRTSVLDATGRAHSLRNLFVADGSFMPTSGGASTTLTIAANALRTADHILGKSSRLEL